jgi:hypothetical protein
MELIAPMPSKATKKAENQKKVTVTRQQIQLYQPQQQQRRNSQGANPNQSAMPRRKVGVFGSPKFSPIVEEQNMRAEGLNPNNPNFPSQQQRKNSRPNQQAAQGAGSNDGGISAWMTRRISGGQLEFARSGTVLLWIKITKQNNFNINFNFYLIVEIV